MRVIKFRGKRTITHDWAYGSLIEVENDNFICGKTDMEQDGHHIRQTTDMPLEVDSDTIGQFTSLYDKNGKEIYEGDIIRLNEEKDLIEVRFVRGVFAFLWNGNLDDEFPCNAPTQEWAEVIGNIHDNPKLIQRFDYLQ